MGNILKSVRWREGVLAWGWVPFILFSLGLLTLLKGFSVTNVYVSVAMAAYVCLMPITLLCLLDWLGERFSLPVPLNRIGSIFFCCWFVIFMLNMRSMTGLEHHFSRFAGYMFYWLMLFPFVVCAWLLMKRDMNRQRKQPYHR